MTDEADAAPTAPGSPSRTALGVALHRAAHLWLDDRPPILDDAVSARLLWPDAEAFVREHPERYQSAAARALRTNLVVRSRLAEDRLAVAVSRGVQQAVLLGAGLDTFAYRQPAWARDLRILELDHLASQAFKRERLASAGIEIPENVRLAPVDLRSDVLVDALRRAGLDLEAPVFIAWLGVMMYLPPETNDAILRATARLAPGSELVFTFAHPPRLDFDRVARAAADAGEAWLDRPGARVMASRLVAAGWRSFELVTPAEIAARYFEGRTDLPAPRRTAIAIART